MKSADDDATNRSLQRIAAEALPPTDLLGPVRQKQQRRRVRALRSIAAAGVVVASVGAVLVLSPRGGNGRAKTAVQAAVPAAGAVIAGPAGLPAAISGGRLTAAADSLGGNQVELRVPPVTLMPRVTAVAAYASCLTDLDAHCAGSKGPTIVLAIVSTDTGGTVRADGTVARVLDGSPTWLFTWTGLTCEPVSGGGPVVASPDTTPAMPSGPVSLPCTRYSLVDASSGKWVSTVDVMK